MGLCYRWSKGRILIINIWLCFFIIHNVNAHVALTFPPARKYDLDFLDNSRTPPPCGMPKGMYHI